VCELTRTASQPTPCNKTGIPIESRICFLIAGAPREEFFQKLMSQSPTPCNKTRGQRDPDRISSVVFIVGAPLEEFRIDISLTHPCNKPRDQRTTVVSSAPPLSIGNGTRPSWPTRRDHVSFHVFLRLPSVGTRRDNNALQKYNFETHCCGFHETKSVSPFRLF